MNLAEQICEKAKDLPEPLAKEVLEFIGRIHARQDICVEEMKNAQAPVMKRIWENEEDDVWNEL